MGRRVSSLGGWAIAVAGLMPALCFGQATSNAQTFVLSDTKDLVLLNVKADAIEYQGRQAVRLTKETEKDGFALLRGTDLQDGAIEADIALKITTPPGVRMPGFVGIAFRARPDASRYELFCLRDRKSTRLNSSHLVISYAVFCLKKKKKIIIVTSTMQ